MYKKIIVGVTPARGGSKRIPNKNMKLLNGTPLVGHTFEHAKKSKLLDRYIVSTENKTIMEYCLENNVEYVHRPLELVGDFTSTESVLQHALKYAYGDIFVLLQCTSPIRHEELINYCIKAFLDHNADTVFTCIKEDGVLIQDGSVYVIGADVVRMGKRFGVRVIPICVKHGSTIDIDSEADFDDALHFMTKN